MDTIVTPVTVITLDSTRIVHSIKADLVSRYFPPVVRLVQYDQSLPVIAISLMQNGQAYTLPSGAAANIRVHKPDSTYVYNPALGCDSTRKIVYFEVTQAMAAANGDGLAIIEIVVNGDIAGTSLITLHFEENPVPEDAIESSDEWETIYELGERIIASTVTPVSTAAGMTDHNVVYLYTGTESGWNQGHMYYYNGTTWVDAGIAVTDTTLSVAGLAADAKKTGDEIADVKDGLTAVETDALAAYATDTVTGAIASFSDGADGVPVKSLTVDIEPVQSGSGDPSPTNVRPISGHTSAVVTRTGFNVWDEETSLLGSRLLSSYISVKPNTQYYRVSPKALFPLYFDESKTEISTGTWGTGVFTTPANCVYLRFQVDPAYGTTYNHDISINYPATDTEYHAYNGQTVTIDLDGTRYGGSLDVSTGVLTVDRVAYTFANGTGLTEGTDGNADWLCVKHQISSDLWDTNTRTQNICSHAPFTFVNVNGHPHFYTTRNIFQLFVPKSVYASFSAFTSSLATNPLTFVAMLSTPTTVQLTANEVKTVLGQNNIWNDCGDTTVEYRADTKLYIQKVLNG